MSEVGQFFFKALGLCTIFHKQTRVAKVDYALCDPKTGMSCSCTSYSYTCAKCEPEKLAQLQARAAAPNPAVDREVLAKLDRQHQEMLQSASPSVRRRLKI